DHPAVIGFDLLNEPHGYSWDEWAPIAEQAGNMLLASHPNNLIIVEGVETYQGDSHWWGGNLQGVADRPIQLNADNKLVYSPHEYATSVFEQPYFNAPGYDPETTLPHIFSENWGFIEEQSIAPLLLGEFGSTFDSQVDKDWAPVLSEYLLDNDIDWAVWSWNPNSGDTEGVVEADWQTPRQEAFTYLLDALLAEGSTQADADMMLANMMAQAAENDASPDLMPVEDMIGV
ncbi:MAG: cellulase family glycosylhydrolase, partial [Pseudomonadota bacterium]